MKNDSYLEKEVIKIPQFEVGGEYKDDNGNEYKVLSIQGDLMEAKFNFVKKKFRIIRYGSTMAAVNSGRVWFRSAKPDRNLSEMGNAEPHERPNHKQHLRLVGKGRVPAAVHQNHRAHRREHERIGNIEPNLPIHHEDELDEKADQSSAVQHIVSFQGTKNVPHILQMVAGPPNQRRQVIVAIRRHPRVRKIHHANPADQHQ